MRVLVACEESQTVCKAFRKLGHEAYSCDILPCSGGHPEWHLQMDCFEALKLNPWDKVISFPPCTAPSQIVQPYMFGDKAQKSTCLWLEGLPKLQPTDIVEKGDFYISPSGKKLPKWYGDASDENGKKIAYGSALMKQIRSKTFQGIADAMASQWSNPVYSHQQVDLFTQHLNHAS